MKDFARMLRAYLPVDGGREPWFDEAADEIDRLREENWKLQQVVEEITEAIRKATKRDE